MIIRTSGVPVCINYLWNISGHRPKGLVRSWVTRNIDRRVIGPVIICIIIGSSPVCWPIFPVVLILGPNGLLITISASIETIISGVSAQVCGRIVRAHSPDMGRGRIQRSRNGPISIVYDLASVCSMIICGTANTNRFSI